MASQFRRQVSGWARWRPSPGVVGVLVALTAAFIAIWIADRDAFVMAHFALVSRRALGREPWQLFTTAFVHLRFVALASSGIGIWFFATPVETRAGRGYLFKLLIGATLAGSIASALVGRLLPIGVYAGASAAAIGSIAAFGRVYKDEPVLLFGVQSIRATVIAYIFLGIWAVSYFVDHDWMGLSGGVAAAAWGAFGTDLSWPRVRLWITKGRLWRVRRKYKVLDGGKTTTRYLN